MIYLPVSETKWETNELTYKIKNYTPDLDRATVDRILQRAFEVSWGKLKNFRKKKLFYESHPDE